jgi:serine/threonine protein phosphatase PrpC
MTGDGVYDKLNNQDVVKVVWETTFEAENPHNIHKVCGECCEMVLKRSAASRTLDNITTLIISFANFKRGVRGFRGKLKKEELY